MEVAVEDDVGRCSGVERVVDEEARRKGGAVAKVSSGARRE